MQPNAGPKRLLLETWTGIGARNPKGEILHLMGDQVALADTFESLYRSSVAEMTRLAFLITGSNHAAEEIAHDSFIAVQARWESIKKPKAYLRRAVVNRSRSHLRRLRTRRNSPVEPNRPIVIEDIDETWELIQRLPAKPKAAIVLRYYMDLSINEIADVMNTRPGTVKSLLHRGRETLRSELS